MLLIWLVFLFDFANSQRCLTTNRNNKPCVFPFKFKGETYNSCTTETDPDGRYWCSTKVNSQFEHVRGNWGYCPNKCEQIRSSQTSTAKTGKCLTHKNTVCALPFKYNGKLYSTCTTEGDPDGKYWCSTKVDSNLDHVKGGGFWGYCSGKCGTETSTKRPFESRPIVTQTTNKPILSPTTQKSRLSSNTKDTSNGQYQPTEADGTCGLYLGTGFIIGGVETKRGELSFLANIGYKNRRTGKISYNCGGTLINRRYVITAGHCHLPNSRNKRISQVVLGDWDLSQDPDCNFSSCKSAQKFDITNKDVTVQEGFDISTTVTVGNDIALIRLPRLATTFLEDVDQTVIPACLGWNNNIQVPKKSAIVAGWGRTTNNRYDRGDYGFAGVFSSVLKKVEANIRPASVCERTFPSFNRQKQICAGGEIFGQDSCSGDSGGPLLASDGNDFKSTKYIVGVVSYGTLECGTGHPAVYTSIEYFRDWIISKMRP